MPELLVAPGIRDLRLHQRASMFNKIDLPAARQRRRHRRFAEKLKFENRRELSGLIEAGKPVAGRPYLDLGVAEFALR